MQCRLYVVVVLFTDNNSESSANSLPLFAMSGDGQTDVVIAMVFLFGAESRHLMDALRLHSRLVVYVGDTARQSSTSTHPSIHQSIHPNISLYIRPFIHPFIHPSIHTSIHSFIHPFMHAYH